MELLFEKWYAGGALEYRTFYDLGIPPDELGRIPVYEQIRSWAGEYRWHERKEELNSIALVKAEKNLVDGQVRMWARHASFAQKVGDAAYQHILKNGFDSSASAIQALKWAQEEERKTRGAEAFIESVKNKSNDELLTMIRNLAERQLTTEEIIEIETEDAEPSN